ncbi:hypothetical protein [Phytohalomonas tamaricis]|uniref:hypothetical protein n=1 Tax=Phytohalomonas tamaricis TaxID=2081032 RepID=UPI000D0BCFD8|nr:hypothetical protein [Phytohalomonas tamaricis]
MQKREWLILSFLVVASISTGCAHEPQQHEMTNAPAPPPPPPTIQQDNQRDSMDKNSGVRPMTYPSRSHAEQ